MHTQGHPKNGPDDYLSLYRSEARSAIVRFTGFAALLIFIWVTTVESVYEAGRKYTIEYPYLKKTNLIYSEQLIKLAQTCTVSECTFDPSKDGISSKKARDFLDDVKNDQVIRKLLDDTRKSKLKINELNTRRGAVKTKTIKLLDYEIQVPNLINGLVLQILILVFLFDIKRTRRRLFDLLIKASVGFGFAHKDTLQGPVKDFAGLGPFWMSPSGSHFSNCSKESNANGVILHALGWVKEESQQKSVIFSIFLFALVLLCCRAGYIEFSLTSTNAPISGFVNVGQYEKVFPYSLLSNNLPTFLRVFSVLVFVCVAALALTELVPPNVNAETRTDRRLFLVFTGSFAATLSFLLPSDVPRWKNPNESDSSKDKRVEITKELDVRLVQYAQTAESEESTTILVDSARPDISQPKGTVEKKSFAPDEFLSEKELTLIFKNLAPEALPEAAELFALQKLESANAENLDSQRAECLNFLKMALNFAMKKKLTKNRFPNAPYPDTPIRLFDLYALLAVLDVLDDKEGTHLKEAIRLAKISSAQPRNQKRLKRRIDYWQDVEKFKDWAGDRKERPWQVHPRGSGQIVKVSLA